MKGQKTKAALICVLPARSLIRGCNSSSCWQKERWLQCYACNATAFSASEFIPNFFGLFMDSPFFWFYNCQWVEVVPRLIPDADPAEAPLSGEYGIPYLTSHTFGVFQMSRRSVFQSNVKCVCNIVVLLGLGRVTVRELSIETALFKSFE